MITAADRQTGNDAHGESTDHASTLPTLPPYSHAPPVVIRSDHEVKSSAIIVDDPVTSPATALILGRIRRRRPRRISGRDAAPSTPSNWKTTTTPQRRHPLPVTSPMAVSQKTDRPLQ